ncbi:hypothetical protein BN128_1389 [Cronobacter sakazakii 696]|nr:hypothetical protein BN128_1389 [Cronobacter sakazakii 696]
MEPAAADPHQLKPLSGADDDECEQPAEQRENRSAQHGEKSAG